MILILDLDLDRHASRITVQLFVISAFLAVKSEILCLLRFFAATFSPQLPSASGVYRLMNKTTLWGAWSLVLVGSLIFSVTQRSRPTKVVEPQSCRNTIPVTAWSDEQFRLKLHAIIGKARAAVEKDRAAGATLELDPASKPSKSSI